MCSIHLVDATAAILCQNAHHTPAYWWRGDYVWGWLRGLDGQKPMEKFGQDARVTPLLFFWKDILGFLMTRESGPRFNVSSEGRSAVPATGKMPCQTTLIKIRMYWNMLMLHSHTFLSAQPGESVSKHQVGLAEAHTHMHRSVKHLQEKRMALETPVQWFGAAWMTWLGPGSYPRSWSGCDHLLSQLAIAVS